MMTFFRNFFKSKIGLGITLLFLALIAFAFASSDVANTGTFGGIGNSGRVAAVGNESISTAELSRSTTSALTQVRQEDPTLSMPAFVAQGGLDEVLNQMIDRLAIASYASDIGLRAGDNLVNSEIRKIGAFQGPSGSFDENSYRQALRNIGVTDAQLRDDLGQGLLAQQIITPASLGATIPGKLARRYAALFKERREGSIILVPTAGFLPAAAPTNEQLSAYYNANRSAYIRPERRVIRYASFDDSAIEGRIAPTDAAIAAYYRENQQQYAASETRRFEQVILPSEQAAQALATAVRGGASLDAAARQQGLRAAEIGPSTQREVAADASPAVAQAYFAAASNAVTTPARSSLGWHVARVTQVERTAGRSLPQARDEIAATLRERNRLAALADVSASIEEQLTEGVSLAEVAQEFGLEIKTTPAVTSNGAVYESPEGATVDPLLQPALATAFQMDESEPQIAEVERGQRFVVFEVSQIAESATAPLAQIRDRVAGDWRVDQGAKAARASADQVLAALNKGQTPQAALSAGKVQGGRVETINLTRQQLAEQGNARIPPPIALLFSMAQGTTKRLEAPGRQGWFVVTLDEVIPGEIAENDPLLTQARTTLGPVLGEEYVQQTVLAFRKAQGVERNDDAIAAVRAQLAGEN